MARPDPRLSRLLSAARRIADPRDEIGRAARAELIRSSGLSPEGVELAFRRSWEADADPGGLEPLRGELSKAAAVHVLLSANVFTGALRAIAIALLQSRRVLVRASRREPALPRSLHEAGAACFELVSELAPQPGDHVWAYASDETLASLRSTLPEGVVLHAHGSGIGIAVVQGTSSAELRDAAARLAEDVIVFDQRGCLSPRIAFVESGQGAARELAHCLAERLGGLEQRVPLGRLSPGEAAAVTRFRDSALYAGELLEAGRGFVGFGCAAVLLPPIGRNLQLHVAPNLPDLLRELAPLVTCVGVEREDRALALTQILPGARIARLGAMQSPPLDGPVDRRADPRGELIRRGRHG